MPRSRSTNRGNGLGNQADALAKELSHVRRELRKTRRERDDYQRALSSILKKAAREKRNQYEKEFKLAVSEPPLEQFIEKHFN